MNTFVTPVTYLYKIDLQAHGASIIYIYMIILIFNYYMYIGKRMRTNNVGYEQLDEWKVIASTLKYSVGHIL